MSPLRRTGHIFTLIESGLAAGGAGDFSGAGNGTALGRSATCAETTGEDDTRGSLHHGEAVFHALWHARWGLLSQKGVEQHPRFADSCGLFHLLVPVILTRFQLREVVLFQTVECPLLLYTGCCFLFICLFSVTALDKKSSERKACIHLLPHESQAGATVRGSTCLKNKRNCSALYS